MCISQLSPTLALPFLLILAISTIVTSIPIGESPTLPIPNHVLYQFPNPTWIESLVVRSSGGILVTLLTTPDLYLIDPSHQNATLVYSFPFVVGLHSIAELEDDLFYIVAGNISLATFVTTPASFSIWEVDMRSFSHSSGALVRKVTDIPEAVFPNGATALSDCMILIADSALALVWKVNVHTGSYSITISDPSMAAVERAALGIGINGIKIRDDHLYFTNSNQGIFCRVPISTSGTATGKVEILAMVLTPDDFALDSQGRAWISQNPSNMVSAVLTNGTVVHVVGSTDQLTVAGPTACAFARDHNGGKYSTISGLLNGEENSGILYCCTAGGLAAPVNGTVVEGGKVVIIHTECLESIAVRRLHKLPADGEERAETVR